MKMEDDKARDPSEKPFKAMSLDHVSFAFAIILALTSIVQSSPAENKVMRKQRAYNKWTLMVLI